MVLAERNPEIMRNGRRSRGPSPNGHGGTPDSSSEDDSSIKKNGSKSKKQSEYEEKIRVGRDYQAVCPELIPPPERKIENLNDRALLVWSPTKDIPDNKLEEYISVAKEKYGYNGEQALGMLFWHKHDLERAVMDLANFTPFPDEWTVEDKVLFEQAFQFHGKSFHRIRQMLPDKSIASLVKYYYSWKKTRHRQSVMDRQEKAKAKDGSENGSENGSNEESDGEEKDPSLVASQDLKLNSEIGGANNKSKTLNVSATSRRQPTLQQSGVASTATNSNTQATSSTAGCCSGCGVPCNMVNNTPHGRLCNSCFHHWRRTGTKRPTTGPYFGKRFRDRNAERYKRKPPRGMHINHDDIVALAGSSNNQDELLSNMDREIVALLSQVQQNKQVVSSLKRKNSDSIEELRPQENASKINPRWSNDELLLAVQGVKKFGKDFQAIAEIIGTKTEAQVRTFFVNYRRRYNLDSVLKEYEAEKDLQQKAAQNSNSNNDAANLSSNRLQAEGVIMEVY
ncbi:REST corepressor 2 isoform X2 [Hermetia illucens]|uniref:REST corepressor 2 isoform X2 n=1 Tax=Hermetia illucens TaxID=343691 RepID=UPI0018CC44A3|nr:REST corepressor 2 isoform X2 [Hermetia illucens]